MAIHKLNARKVAARLAPGLYGDGGNLYLSVGPTGGKSWAFRYMIEGRARCLGLGPATIIDLDAAREHAAELRRMVFNGDCPLAARLAKREAGRAKRMTFAAAAAGYVEAKKAGWSLRHLKAVEAGFKNYCGGIAELDVGAVDTTAVLKILTPIWATKTETADRLRSNIEAALAYATTHKARARENSARWSGHLEHLLAKPSTLAKVERRPSMHWTKAPAFMAAIRAETSIAARALEVLTLTGLRMSEVLKAPREEFYLTAAVWKIPAERMKTREPHDVPLSPHLVELLRALPTEEGNPYMFIGSRPRSCMGPDAVDALVKKHAPGSCIHGLRSTFKNWAVETKPMPDFREVSERVLAHKIAGVRGAYETTTDFDNRRALMNAWAAYLEGAK